MKYSHPPGARGSVANTVRRRKNGTGLISEAQSRVEDLPTSVCAVLLAEACNIGLEPLIRGDNPALIRNRLSWIQQNYIRAETLAQANPCLVDCQVML